MKLLKIYNELIIESINELKYSPIEVFNYINKLHRNGWEKSKYEDKEWIEKHKYFILKWVDLNDPNIKWNYPPPIYQKLTTPFPPIVISYDGWIMDGMHRASSAKARDDNKIEAYIGHL